MGVECVTPKLNKSPFNHFNSHTSVAVDRYSTSAKDLDTVCCLFVFKDIGESPRNTNHTVRDLRVKGQLAQSESHSLRNRMPWPGLLFKYQTTLNAASQCFSYECCINCERTCTE